jgi:hypothetical protein
LTQAEALLGPVSPTHGPRRAECPSLARCHGCQVFHLRAHD